MMSAVIPVTFASFSVWMSLEHSPVFVQVAMSYLEPVSARVKKIILIICLYYFLSNGEQLLFSADFDFALTFGCSLYQNYILPKIK